MKRLVKFLAPLLFVLPQFHCSDIDGPSKLGTIVVFVNFREYHPLSGKKVEIVQTGEVRMTNENGLAEFRVHPGKYTVRVYDINRGGPCCAYVDTSVEVRDGETQAVKVFDCLDCV